MTYLNHKIQVYGDLIDANVVFPLENVQHKVIFFTFYSMMQNWSYEVCYCKTFGWCSITTLHLNTHRPLHAALRASFPRFRAWSILGRDDHNFSGNCYGSLLSLDPTITWPAVP